MNRVAAHDVVADLRRWMADHHQVVLLTGAGCSTASGIPDYRDAQGDWKRQPPVMFQAFRTQESTYRRYWARAFAGWPRFTAAEPGAAHHALAAWQQEGSLARLITQNVDGLHQRAGSRNVIDLHGRLDVVVCLTCRDRTSRSSVQDAMAAANSQWNASAAAAPDGTIAAVLVATGLALVLVGPAFALLYVLDQKTLLPEEGMPEPEG